jgi:NDP-sugar pyrophosphorylase family protein
MMPMTQAFVLGAGLGTRLLPLTQHRPKPLIPVANRPLITYAFDHLRGVGVERFVVNTHWRAEAYAREFPDAQYRGAPIAFRHETPEVLETGGGIKNAEDLLRSEPFWVYNGDILATLPLEPALHAHRRAGNEVTLVLRSQDGPLQIAFDEASGLILDVGRRLHPDLEPRFLFTGIYLVEPVFLARLSRGKHSVVPVFCEMIRAGAKLGGVVIDEGRWFDLGSRTQYLAVHQALSGGPWIDPTATIALDAQILGASAIGAGAEIGPRAIVRNSLVWPGACVAEGADLTRCIVAGGQTAQGALVDQDVA